LFDLETDGLIRKRKRGEDVQDENDGIPHIVEICWSICSPGSLGAEEKCVVEDTQTFLVRPDGRFVIPEEATKVHGIPHDRAQADGGDVVEVLSKFLEAARGCQILAAHNIAFDLPVLQAECRRHKLAMDAIDSQRRICTMMSTIALCKITREGKRGFKFPKLEELYRFLFAEEPNQVHQAEDDVRLLRLCFFELVKRGVIRLHVDEVQVGKFVADVTFSALPAMTVDQKQMFDAFAKGRNVKFVGGAGSGKSTFLLHLVLHSARNSKQILFVTHTKYQRLEAQLRMRAMNISQWVNVQSYWSLASLCKVQKDEYGNVTKATPRTEIRFDTLLFDEFQEVTPGFCEMLKTIIKHNQQPDSQIAIAGDPKQVMFQFNGADASYLLGCEAQFENNKRYKMFYSKQSLRFPPLFVKFFNKHIHHDEELKLVNSGPTATSPLFTPIIAPGSPQVKRRRVLDYDSDPARVSPFALDNIQINDEPMVWPIVTNVCAVNARHSRAIIEHHTCASNPKVFITQLNLIIAQCLAQYGSGEIAILSPSATSPSVSAILVGLTAKDEIVRVKDVGGANDFVSSRGKIMFGSFFDFKGTERKCTIVLGFDDSYFRIFEKTDTTVCPSAIYVALTRASEKIVLVRRAGSKMFPSLLSDVDRDITMIDQTAAGYLPNYPSD